MNGQTPPATAYQTGSHAISQINAPTRVEVGSEHTVGMVVACPASGGCGSETAWISTEEGGYVLVSDTISLAAGETRMMEANVFFPSLGTDRLRFNVGDETAEIAIEVVEEVSFNPTGVLMGVAVGGALYLGYKQVSD